MQSIAFLSGFRQLDTVTSQRLFSVCEPIIHHQWLFLIPLILILPFFFGMDGILYAAPIADDMAFVVTTLFMASFTTAPPAIIRPER